MSRNSEQQLLFDELRNYRDRLIKQYGETAHIEFETGKIGLNYGLIYIHAKDFQMKNGLRSIYYYKKAFGGLDVPLRELGLSVRNPTREDLIEELWRLNQCLGRTPKKLDWEEYPGLSKYSSTTFEKYFGTWNRALTIAGLPLNRSRNPPRNPCVAIYN